MWYVFLTCCVPSSSCVSLLGLCLCRWFFAGVLCAARRYRGARVWFCPRLHFMPAFPVYGKRWRQVCPLMLPRCLSGALCCLSHTCCPMGCVSSSQVHFLFYAPCDACRLSVVDVLFACYYHVRVSETCESARPRSESGTWNTVSCRTAQVCNSRVGKPSLDSPLAVRLPSWQVSFLPELILWRVRAFICVLICRMACVFV